MTDTFKDISSRQNQPTDFKQKNRQRFDSIISDTRFNYLESIYQRLFDKEATLTDVEILEAYFKFSDKIQTNTFAAAELEWVSISTLCYFRPHLTETLLRRGLLCIVYSLGDDIDSFTVLQFINERILANTTEPYGGLPPDVGLHWLTDILPKDKETIQKVLEEVINKNRNEIEGI
ncbi:MAG: hypothetical protein EOP45_15750 [Sphingobacteriaceae bacterium]|nr:MAG: hypothetical protein EOP45_15750 [Sphingobacteriaceae bacterium]